MGSPRVQELMRRAWLCVEIAERVLRPTPRLVNGSSVPINDGVAIFTVQCDSAMPCAGTMTVTLSKPSRSGTAEYALAAGATTRLGVLLPGGHRAKRGSLTWHDTTGAEVTTSFAFAR